MSGSPNLTTVLSLGTQSLTGVFPRDKNTEVSSGPVDLVLCTDSGLLQLKQTYDIGEMYGSNYGYRSGLNAAMVAHLQQKVASLLANVHLDTGDIVLDIGSNDSTLLRSYPDYGQRMGGIDPSAEKFREYYPPHIALLPEFFSAAAFHQLFGSERAKIVTSVAMLYDLEAPLTFMREVESILADDGIWHFEQSYMPLMLKANAYDTICQEHLEYYALSQIKWMTDRSGLRILDVQLNDVNGGSFAVTVAKADAPYTTNREVVERLLADEERQGLGTLRPYEQFRENVFAHRDDLVKLVRTLRSEGKTVLGYGASTKGNVLLQLCGFTEDDIACIAEVNSDKFGCYTPGTRIPIVSEIEAHRMNPDYFLVLPWHFRDNIMQREAAYIAEGGKMIFPLPNIEIAG